MEDNNIIYNNTFVYENENININKNNNNGRESMELKEKTNNYTSTEINNNSDKQTTTNINIKHPKRIVYYGDGPREEYSSDEEEEEEVDKTLQTWPTYFLSILDNVGERLAYMLGITSPKYQYAIDEHHRRIMEEKEDEEYAQREQTAWEENIVIRKTGKGPYNSANFDKESDGNIAVISASNVIVSEKMVVGGVVLGGGEGDGEVLGGGDGVVLDGGDGLVLGGGDSVKKSSAENVLGQVNEAYSSDANKF